jgi:ribosomal protein S18 acetylase RimI-like enzyme
MFSKYFMFIPNNKQIKIATEVDLPQIVVLLNNAYRGNQSRAGWTTEADLIQGDVRTTLQHVQDVFLLPDSVFFTIQQDAKLLGCVNLQVKQGKVYLGMFAVEPTTQGAGLGKALLLAAEEWAGYQKIAAIYMTVISVRTELIQWYMRHGYVDTQERIPFEEDGYSGTHVTKLSFAVLEKQLEH